MRNTYTILKKVLIERSASFFKVIHPNDYTILWYISSVLISFSFTQKLEDKEKSFFFSTALRYYICRNLFFMYVGLSFYYVNQCSDDESHERTIKLLNLHRFVQEKWANNSNNSDLFRSYFFGNKILHR